MSRIKAIVWDVGGVLSRTGDLSWHQQWETRLGLPPGGLGDVVFNNQLAVVGKITEDVAWQDVGRKLNLAAEELTALRGDFWKGSEWNLDLFDYIRSLKGRYKLGILSDATLGVRERVKDQINYDLFDVIMFSAEEGIRKPDPEMYQRMLSRLGINADEAIFIDDRIDNIEGAWAVGMHGIQFLDRIDIKAAIEEITGAGRSEGKAE